MGCLCSLAILFVVALLPCHAMPLHSTEKWLQQLEMATAKNSSHQDLCFVCLGAMDFLQILLEKNSTLEDLLPVMEPLCNMYMNKTHDYYGPYMCPGILQSYGPVVLYVLAEKSIRPQKICYLLHLCNSSEIEAAPSPFSQTLHHSLTNAPERQTFTKASKRLSIHSNAKKKKRKDSDKIVFIQISDIHLDREFSEGSPSKCNLYLCCRSWYNGTSPAERYGSYSCDLPLVTLDLVVETIAQLNPQPDFIIYTGDNAPHEVWNETWPSQIEATQFLMDYLSQKLPNTTIYPALGNHESYPESEYMGTLSEYQELNEALVKYWSSLVDLPESALYTISQGAYYTTTIQDRLRVLSFNSDYGYNANFYSFLDEENAFYNEQKQWMADTVALAEAAGEKVLIIAHIPPGDRGTTLQDYENFYLNLTRSHQHTIVGHLFGHTHHDEFKLIQDENGAYGVVSICPSVTPYGRSNPSFRVFSMNPSSYQLLGYQQYHLNLSLANEMAAKGEKPTFELAYTTSDLYHLPDLSPTSYADLIERFANYPELVSQYVYNMYGQSSLQDLSCDSQCVHDTICSVSNIITLQKGKCIQG